MNNIEILLDPLRNQKAVTSSRMEGTISTMDEILKFEADSKNDTVEAKNAIPVICVKSQQINKNLKRYTLILGLV